jgi:hypothetical protein
MTTQQLHVFNLLYLFVTVVVAVLTRATPRRIAGALAGGAAAGVVGLVSIRLGERQGWWHMALRWDPYFLTLMMIDFTLCAFIFLITWRIVRRFGGRGLTVFLVVLAIIGPPRDQWYMKRFPEWGSYGPGIAPILAISATYVLLVLAGHGAMRLVAGPARGPSRAAAVGAAPRRAARPGAVSGNAPGAPNLERRSPHHCDNRHTPSVPQKRHHPRDRTAPGPSFPKASPAAPILARFFSLPSRFFWRLKSRSRNRLRTFTHFEAKSFSILQVKNRLRSR